jgi:phosphoglycerate kinase
MDLVDKRVLLRADLNVPLQNGTIQDDFRLRAIQPTLDLLLAKQAHVLLVTHLGRPEKPDPAFSTHILVSWFNQHKYQAVFARTITHAQQLLATNQFVVLENIRFWSEEQQNDKKLAQELRACTDIFVQDAFGALHRTETTITTLPLLYKPTERTIGLLVERELHELNHVLTTPTHPVVAIIGGAKIQTKLPLLEHLRTIADTIALLPAISFSLVQTVFEQTQKLDTKIMLPHDYMVSETGWSGPYQIIKATHVTEKHLILTIGPETVAAYTQLIAHARTIIINGPAGKPEFPATIEPMRMLFQALCNNTGYKLVAGGDAVGLINQCGLAHCASFCSSGGGASIAYLSGQQLPGLTLFVKT